MSEPDPDLPPLEPDGEIDPFFADRPHDGFFKAFFRDPAHAASFLRNHRLPEAIARHVEWETMRLEDTSFISTELRQTQADLLFSVRYRDRQAFFYLLFEHQSTIDPLIRLRLLCYQCELWRHLVEIHGLPLPLVIGFVFNQGPDGWHVSTEFEDLFDLEEGTAADWLPYLPRFRHLLFDLTKVDPAEGEDEKIVQTALQLMKLARVRQHRAFLEWLRRQCVDYAFALHDGDLKTMLLYLFLTDSDLDSKEIVRTLALSSTQEKIAMSAAEKLRIEGRIEGEARGKSYGERIGKISLLENLLGIAPGNYDRFSLEELDARLAQVQSQFDAKFPRP
jgi:predicted transposase/invertase (TIGR01784 family)